MSIAYLGLGSNLGSREQNLARALELLSPQAVVVNSSSLYETEPVGYEEQPHFVNIVCSVSTNLSPDELLLLAKRVEKKLGRKPSFANAPRPVDIDILFYDNQVIKNETLTIPHPRLAERAFVLVPLAQIASDLVHPENRRTVAELLANLGSITGVRKLSRAEILAGGK